MINGDEPIAGYYKTRLARGSVYVPVSIHFGRPIIDHEEQDRAEIWVVTINGETDRYETGPEGYRCRVPLDVYSVWPFCARWPISEADYRFMIDKATWAKSHAPDRPEASPRNAVDWNARKPIL